MGALEENTTNIYGIHLRESANDGSDFSNGAADYRVLFLGEDGQLHVKDSAGTVTSIGSATTLATDTLWDAAGDLVVGTGANTAAKKSLGSALQVLRVNSGATDVEWATASTGSVDWAQDLNVSGTSATGWTAQGGTWSSTGTVIQNTDAGAADKRFRWDTKIPIGFPTIFEAECKVVSGGGLAGITLGYNGASNTGGVWLGIGDTTNKVSFEAPAGTAEIWSSSTTITTGTFYKLRMVSSAVVISIYLDGTLLGSAFPPTGTGNGPWDYVALRCHTAAAEFRNIKLWTMRTGAPA